MAVEVRRGIIIENLSYFLVIIFYSKKLTAMLAYRKWYVARTNQIV